MVYIWMDITRWAQYSQRAEQRTNEKIITPIINFNLIFILWARINWW